MNRLCGNVPRKEKEWLGFIKDNFPSSGATVGNGDDGAVLKKSKYCVTTDLLMEGVDFEKEWAPPEAIGWKALAVNLSDLAAMGSKPLFFFLSIAIPASWKDSEIEMLLAGMKALAGAEKVSLLGGDLSRSRGDLVISICAIGAQLQKALRRGTAGTGDSIYLSHPLGGPCQALNAFKKGSRLRRFPLKGKPEKEDALLDSFFRPPSQSRFGVLLSGRKIASSAIDISDGLLLDLSRLLEKNGLGAVLSGPDVPRAKDSRGNFVSLDDALTGGEEQTLLFTVPKNRERLLSDIGGRFYKIGFVSPKSGIWMENAGRIKKLAVKGFDHFE
jgi:thiamine-monophosphate kinase